LLSHQKYIARVNEPGCVDGVAVDVANKDAYDRGNRAIVACHVGHAV
jgi:hypothetical protein